MARRTYPLLIGAMLLALCAGLGLGSVLSGPLSDSLCALAQAADSNIPGSKSESALAHASASKLASPSVGPTTILSMPTLAAKSKVQAAPGSKAQADSAHTGKSYTVQIASFRTERRAASLAADLRAKGLEAKVQVLRSHSGAKPWYVVRCGEWPSLDQAREQARSVEHSTGSRVLVTRLSGQVLADTPRPKAPAPKKKSSARPALAEKSAPAIRPRPVPKSEPKSVQETAPTPAETVALDRLKRSGVEVVVGLDRDKAKAASVKTPSDRVYLVQAGGYFEPEPATSLAADLDSRGISSSIVYLHGWYVVQSGMFESRDEARARANAVRSATGKEPTVATASRRNIERHAWTPDSQEGAAPKSRELMYHVENWGKPDLGQTRLVGSYADPREAGAQAKKLESQGLAALVVFQTGQAPWRVYQKTPQVGP